MDYHKIHNNFVKKIKSENRDPKLKINGKSAWHKHHIVPRFLMKVLDDSEENTLYLTVREHYFIHRLLMKIYPTRSFISSCNVFLHTYKKYLKQYGPLLIKRLGRILGNSMRGKNHHNYGKSFSDETKIKMTIKKLGRNNPQFGKKWTEERKKKLSASMKKYYRRKYLGNFEFSNL